MDEALKQELKLLRQEAIDGDFGLGEICTAKAYDTDIGEIFVKKYPDPVLAKVMFKGEYAGLKAIQETGTVRVPNPIKVIDTTDGGFLVMERLKIKPLKMHAKELGRELGCLHAANQKRAHLAVRRENFVGDANLDVVSKFGFHVSTCCGRFPMINEWCDNWCQFFARYRLQIHMDIVQKQYHDQEAREIWPHVLRNLPKLFPESLEIKPSLLHGDFWYGNTADLDTGPCVFDPSPVYGHSEFEIAVPHIYGGFPDEFFTEYHKIVPKVHGHEGRETVYKLENAVNHWNHFGPVKHRMTAMRLMRSVANM